MARVVVLTLLAFAIYGSWAFGINFEHGWIDAISAGTAQGISSSIATFTISSAVEICFARLAGHRAGVLAAWLIPPTLTTFVHAGMQWLVGTHDIVWTILPSVIMGYLFAGLYVRALTRAAIIRTSRVTAAGR